MNSGWVHTRQVPYTLYYSYSLSHLSKQFLVTILHKQGLAMLAPIGLLRSFLTLDYIWQKTASPYLSRGKAKNRQIVHPKVATLLTYISVTIRPFPSPVTLHALLTWIQTRNLIKNP